MKFLIIVLMACSCAATPGTEPKTTLATDNVDLSKLSVGELFQLADWHGVLPVVVSNLRKTLDLYGAQRVTARPTAAPCCTPYRKLPDPELA